MNARRDNIVCSCWGLLKTAQAIAIVDLVFTVLYLIGTAIGMSAIEDELNTGFKYRLQDNKLGAVTSTAHEFLIVLIFAVPNLLIGSLFLIGVVKV
jgi:hypothetical protein